MVKKLFFPAIVAICLATPATLLAQGTTKCVDGSTSTATGKGACSGHGGVKKDASKSGSSKSHEDSDKNEATEQKGSSKSKDSDEHGKSGQQVKCGDGSMSAGGQGACSHHGGVAKGKENDDSHAKSSATGATASKGKSESHEASGEKSEGSKSAKGDDSKAEGATAKCKDGTYSHAKQHSGACSKHGGVDSWLDGAK